MTTFALWLAAPLLCVQPSEPPPPPAADDDEVVIVDEDDDEPSDAEYDDEPEPEPELEPEDAETQELADDGATSNAPSPSPSPAVGPAKIPTEGKTKAPPPTAALERDSPLILADKKRRDRSGRPGSPQRFALEFKMGPYLPDVDRDYSGAGLGPYATIFGETDDTGAATGQPKPSVMPVIAFEWQFLYLAGPLGVGTQIGFFRDKAQALIAVPTDPNSIRSDADDTTFTLIPLSLLLTYRFELLADRFNVPFVPYAKGGLAYGVFWNRSGSGNLARNSRGDIARGGVPGWQANLGGMLRLDFIEPGTAKKLDRLTGINHTYIFGEYQISRMDNFGRGQVLNLGDSTWFAGLAIEF